MTHPLIKHTGKWGKTLIGPLGLYALFSEAQNCYGILMSEAFMPCNSAKDVVDKLAQLSHLEQGGVYLYFGMLLVSSIGLAAALWYFAIYAASAASKYIRKWHNRNGAAMNAKE
jgi:hypothetical protein